MIHEINNIVSWLQEKVTEANAKGLIVGVSGGLDSAVVANLIKRAFPNNSLGVIMPLKTNVKDIEDANSVVRSSGIDSLTIDLTETHQILFDEIKNQLKDKNTLNESMLQLSDANLRARLRMSTLYSLAQNYNYLVVGTDNKSEACKHNIKARKY